MNLPARVRQALNEAVLPTEFERCACALLQSRYPGLAAVEGGHDFGRDADIYFPHGSGGSGGRGRLLVTTGDPVANVRNGLRRMQEEGLRIDLVVVACSRPVDARTRRKLDQLCADRGLSPAEVYAQEWFVHQLVRDAAWRRSLLGIEGRLGVLLETSLETPLAASPHELVGRQAELEALSMAVASGQDVVLVGVPGVGKTRLTGRLGDGAFYLETASLHHLPDELLLTCPGAVIVDDAHAHLDAVRVLRQARRQTGVAFCVVATTWPDRLESVLGGLPGATVVSVPLLERTEMDTLVSSAGVTGHRARAAVLDQADGRPGWAVTLCALMADGQSGDVFSGQGHVAHVERHLREVTSSPTVLDVLACVAALGGASLETLYALASVVAVAPAELSGLMENLAHNGLVESVRGTWQLQPALCAPLVARWFFTSPARRPWATLAHTFPDRALDLASSVMSAAAVSASPQARAQAEAWITSLPAPEAWSASVFGVVAQYARLDLRAAEFAVQAALTVLAAEREPEETDGMSVDRTRQAAVRQLIQSARQFLLPQAVDGLLSLAVGDTRRRSSTPEHPLRVLTDLAGMIDPDFGTFPDIRARLLRMVLDWLREHHSSAEQWSVAADALSGIFSVEVSGNWPSPGAVDTITFVQGIDSAANLSGLLRLWELVVPVLNGETVREGGIPCPPAALITLLETARGWVRLALNEDLSAEQQQCGAAGGILLLGTLRPLLQHSPGTALRAQRDLARLRPRAEAAGLPLPDFDIDPDLDAFCEWAGVDFSTDHEVAAARVFSQAQALAEKLTGLGARAGVARFDELTRQAAVAGGAAAGHLTATRMGELMTDPAAWYEAANASGNTLVLGAALRQWLSAHPGSVPIPVLRPALDDASTRPAVIGAILARDVVDEAGEAVISSLTVLDAGLLEMLMRHEPDEVMHRLLIHPDPTIAASAAVSFSGLGAPHGPALPQQWRTVWRSAIEGLRLDHLSEHNQWRAGLVLEHLAQHDPDMFEAWFRRRLSEATAQGWYISPLPRDSAGILSLLPRPHRLRLAVSCIGLPRIGHSALIHLVSSDPEGAKQLLDVHAVTADKLVPALDGQRNPDVEQLGVLLLERGVPADRIAAAMSFYDFWSGDLSRLHTELLEYFTALADRVPALQAVAAAGRLQQQDLLKQALERERSARIRGR
ncbi:hypothetical protein [Streptomyces sp. NPDC048720]|uniref:hypothetical protein n=1 Tax=Streptomyces sp. NPDC048720 TaxID=3365588 RepID=UPI0037180C2D